MLHTTASSHACSEHGVMTDPPTCRVLSRQHMYYVLLLSCRVQLGVPCLQCNLFTLLDTLAEETLCLQPTQAINYLGAFYLTHLLMQKVKDTRNSRILNTTSLVEPTGAVDWGDLGYACSLLCSALCLHV